MAKTLADAIFEAEKHTKQAPKFAALSGLDQTELDLVFQALNPYRVFNIRKYDAPPCYAAVDPVGYGAFLKLLDLLHDRVLTGNAAKAAVLETLSKYTERTAKALARVLDQDLKCGATVTAFKKIYPDLNVPEFDLMGAEKMDPKYKWQFPCIAESKYDGQRAIIRIDGDDLQTVTYYSRNGKPLDHLIGKFDDVARAFAKHFGMPMIMDGEALAGSFQETVQSKKAEGREEAKAALKFYVFDFMTAAEWDAKHCPLMQEARSTQLEAVVKLLNLPRLVKSKSKILHNMEEAHEFYAQILAEGFDDDGKANGLGEGLIIKYMDGYYQWNLGGSRGPEWTKWKPVFDFDLTIVDIYEGEVGTKNEGKLGGWVLEGKDENDRPIKTNCGGFKVSNAKMLPLLREIAAKLGGQIDNEKKPGFIKNRDQMFRQYVWDNFNEFQGKTGLFEAQEMCLAENATEWALRFPQFIFIRTDK